MIMERKSRKIVQALSYISLFIIGIVLLLDVIIGVKAPEVMNILKNIANVLAYIVVCVNGFFFVRTKRSAVYVFLYIFALILIIVCYVLPYIR